MTAIAVTIAGSDSGGGAGIQADLKTFSALGVYGASVITALTAQNTKGVTGIHDVPPEFIGEQIDAVFSDLVVDAVKIGMLSHDGDDRSGDGRARPARPDQGGARSGHGRDLRRPAARAGRGRDAGSIADSARAGDHAEPAGSGRAARPAHCGERGRDARPGRAADPARRQERADQGRPRQRCGERRSAGRARHRHAACRAAHRDAEHARHRLHAVVGDCRRVGEGLAAARGGARGEGFCHRRDRRREPPHDRFRARAGAPLPSLVERSERRNRRNS